MNKNLYGNKIELPEEVKTYLSKCFDVASHADDTTEGYKRNKELRDSGFVTYQQLKRMKNWFDNFSGTENDLPFILNGAHYMKDWVNKTLGAMRKNAKSSEDTKEIERTQFLDNYDAIMSLVVPEDAPPEQTFNPNANFENIAPEDVARIMVADFLTDQRERPMTSIYALDTPDGTRATVADNTSSSLIELSKIEITKRMKMNINDFYNKNKRLYSKKFRRLWFWQEDRWNQRHELNQKM